MEERRGLIGGKEGTLMALGETGILTQEYEPGGTTLVDNVMGLTN